MALNQTGTILRNHRKQAKLSCAELAVVTGLDASTISRIETETRKPTRETLQQLAVGLKLDEAQVAELLGSAGFAVGEPSGLASSPAFDELDMRIDRALRLVPRLSVDNRLRLVGALASVLRQLEAVWLPLGANPIPYLPEHGPEHTRRMLEALTAHFGEELSRLEYRNLALLCYAIALHDIGIALCNDGVADPHRKYHELSAEYVKNHYLELGISEGEATVVSNLCRHHGGFQNLSALEITEVPGALRADEQKTLLAFLRLADLLEIRPERVQKNLDALMTNLPAMQEVQGEWLRQLFIHRFRRDGSALVAEVRYHRSWGQESIRNLIDALGLELQAQIVIVKDVLVEAGCKLLRGRTEAGPEPPADLMEPMETIRRSLGRFFSARNFFRSVLDGLKLRLQSAGFEEIRDQVLPELRQKIELRPYHAQARNICEELEHAIASDSSEASKIETMKDRVNQCLAALETTARQIGAAAAREFQRNDHCFLLIGFSECVLSALAALGPEQKKSIHIVVLEFRTKSVYDSDNTMKYCDGARYAEAIRDLEYANVWLAPDVSVASVFTMKERLGAPAGSQLFPLPPTHLLLGVNAIVPFDTKDGGKACGIYSTTGYLTVVHIAREYGAKVYVISESGKIRDTMRETAKPRVHYWLPQDHLWDELHRKEIKIYNPLDDRVLPDSIDYFITEDGVMSPSDLWAHRLQVARDRSSTGC
jgi:translation initiation factor 2B subunit (eIF-2B alpha/beta/delta family)/transcriptional regulator with XRE-family HTH domain